MSEKQAQCERGDVDACRDAARMLDGDNLAGFHDTEGARRMRARACAAGDRESCASGPRDKTAIVFEPGAVALTPEARATLGDVVRTLNANPDITLIDVQGHATTDERDPTLSQRRAELVVGELVVLGIDASRLHAVALATRCGRGPSVTFRMRATLHGPVQADEC